MATTITDECINCGACEPECPNNAIRQADPIYVIDPQLCTECVGFHDYEACAAVCPVDCCVPDPNNVESEEVLIARARALHQDTDFGEKFPSRFRKGDASHAPAAAAGVTAAPASNPNGGVTAPAGAAAAVTVAIAEPAVDAALPAVNGGASVSSAKTAAAEPTSETAAPAPPSANRAAPAKAAPNPPAARPAAAKPEPLPKKTFPNELPESFTELENRYKGARRGPLSKGLPKLAIIFTQPVLGALPHDIKKKLEQEVQSPFFTAAGSTGLNILHNAILYPLLFIVIAAAVQGPEVIFSQGINMYLLIGILLAVAEGVYRLKDGILFLKPADEMTFRAALYGIPLGILLQPLLKKASPMVRDVPIPVDGFYSAGFVEKLERERRYGNVYTIEDLGEALVLRMEFPRRIPDIGLSARSELPDEMPDYDYDLALKDGQFTVKGRCTDPRVRNLSSSIGAFPPEFTSVIPLKERVVGFGHRFQDKCLEVLLVKDTAGYRGRSHR